MFNFVMYITKVKSIRCISQSLCYLNTIINVEHVLPKKVLKGNLLYDIEHKMLWEFYRILI